MQNEDIRNRSEARKNELGSRFGRSRRRSDQTETAFTPLLSGLRDIQKCRGR
jgi:hypothetical protein